jgi:hypothetical protein
MRRISRLDRQVCDDLRRHGSNPPQVLRQPVMLVCGFGHVAA